MRRAKIGLQMELTMPEFIIIVESRADAEISTKLAERVLLEKVEWLEPDTLDSLIQWSGLESGTEHSCWKNIGDIIEHFSTEFNFPKIRSNGKLKTDGKAASKVMKLISFLQYKLKRDITAVIFIRDLDNQPERRQHLDQARSEYTGQPKLEIVIGTADRMREAWVLNGFMSLNPEEEKTLKDITKKLNFNPCTEAHRLRSTSSDERYPKMVVKKLTDGDYSREQQCWEKTNLEILRSRGKSTGLTDYLDEVEKRLIPIISE
jgi:hypothetical protein